MKADISGREYARLDNLKAGDMVQVDNDFTCIRGRSKLEVKSDHGGNLFIDCRDGGHRLDGQENETRHLTGVYKLPIKKTSQPR